MPPRWTLAIAASPSPAVLDLRAAPTHLERSLMGATEGREASPFIPRRELVEARADAVYRVA